MLRMSHVIGPLTMCRFACLLICRGVDEPPMFFQSNPSFKSAGRVKTLHPKVHGGILARRDVPSHMAALEEHSIDLINIVIVNLYPFRQTVTAEQKPAYEVRNTARMQQAPCMSGDRGHLKRPHHRWPARLPTLASSMKWRSVHPFPLLCRWLWRTSTLAVPP